MEVTVPVAAPPIAVPRRRPRRRLAGVAVQAAASALLLGLIVAAVELFVVVRGVEEYMLPRPSRVLSVFFDEWAYFWEHLRSTLRAMLIGTALSFVVSFALASVMATSRILSRGLFGILVVLKLIPTIAVAPLMVMWFGFGSRTQIVVVVLATFFPIVVNLHLGLTEVDRDMVTLLRSAGAKRWQVFTKLRLPNSVPCIFTSLRTALPLSAIGAIVGEWVGSSEGIGYIVKMEASLFRTAHVFGGLLAIGLAGVVLFGLVVLVESRVRRHGL